MVLVGVVRCAASPIQFSSRLNRVAGGFDDVLAAGWGGPSEGAAGELIDLPAGVLLEPVVVAALRSAITQARSAAGLVGDVVLEIGLVEGRRQTSPVQVA